MYVCILRHPFVWLPVLELCLVQNIVWGVNSTLSGLCIPPTNRDLRDLLWHSICAPRRGIQIYLAQRSAGTVWGNPISHTGTPHPQPSFHFRTVSAKWTPQPHCSVYGRTTEMCLLHEPCVFLSTPYLRNGRPHILQKVQYHIPR